MKVWEIGEQSGIESLRITNRDIPFAMHGQAVLSVKACALNHRDLKIARDDYGPPKPKTRIPLADVAAEVVAVGEGVRIGLHPPPLLVARTDSQRVLRRNGAELRSCSSPETEVERKSLRNPPKSLKVSRGDFLHPER